jgi:hypothetical protein
MLLTERERELLAAFIREATTDPFQGPATEELQRRDISFDDLSHLMAAYYGEICDAHEGPSGKPSPAPPPCPWKDRDTAVRRDREVDAELERVAKQTDS